MKTPITPDRKGSRVARRARTDCYLLSALCLIAGVLALLSDDFADAFPALIAGCIALALLGSLFRVLGCMAYDLETIAATKMTEYTEEGNDE